MPAPPAAANPVGPTAYYRVGDGVPAQGQEHSGSREGAGQSLHLGVIEHQKIGERGVFYRERHIANGVGPFFQRCEASHIVLIVIASD